MNPNRPFLLLRARPRDEVRPLFAEWFESGHLKDVARIPGVASVEWGCTPAGTWLGIYSFEDADAVQAALSSPQAAYARGTWQQWAVGLEELQVEIFAPAFPLPIYQSRN